MDKMKKVFDKLYQRMLHVRLKERLLIVNLTCVLIPLIFFGVYINMNTRKILMAQAKEIELAELRIIQEYLFNSSHNNIEPYLLHHGQPQ